MSSTHKEIKKCTCGEPHVSDMVIHCYDGKPCYLKPHAPKAEGMEKRFDYKFPDGLFGVEWYSNRSFKCCWSETLDVKSFIRSEISLALKEERTRIAGMVSEMRKDTPTEFDTGSEFSTPRIIRANGYNQALSDIAARLESEGSLEDKG